MTMNENSITLLALSTLFALSTGCADDPCLDDGWAPGMCTETGAVAGSEDTGEAGGESESGGDSDSGGGETGGDSDSSGTGFDCPGDGDGDESDSGDGDGDSGCTSTQGYWKNHVEDWPLEPANELCSLTWIEIFDTPPEGEAWFILAHQYMAAELNYASGASLSPELEQELESAYELLAPCEISEPQRAEAIELAELLDDYNNGLIGPGHCG